MVKNIFYFLVLIQLVSCDFILKRDKVDTRKPIAKVDSVFLYKEDIIKALPENYAKRDSSLLVNNYINSWAKKQILLSKARLNLNDEGKEINDLVKKYKEDLLINKYREAVVNQNLDTIISEAEIDSFYKKNKELLKLNEELLQLRFIHADKNIMNRKEIEKLFKSKDIKDTDSLMGMGLEFKSFYFNDSTWIKFSDVLKRIPVLTHEDLKKVKKPEFVTKEDSLSFYLIKVNKVLKRNSIAPKEYVLPTVKQMIKHTRKLQLLKEIERTLLNDATKNGQYEIYK